MKMHSSYLLYYNSNYVSNEDDKDNKLKSIYSFGTFLYKLIRAIWMNASEKKTHHFYLQNWIKLGKPERSVILNLSDGNS